MKNMKKNTKDNIANGVGAAMGAAAGFSTAVHVAAHTQEAQTIDEVEVVDAVEVETAPNNVKTVPEQDVEITDISHGSHPVHLDHLVQTTAINTNNSETSQEILHEDNTPEIEVLGYERITDEVGNRMDAAVVSDHGHKITYLDTDLDNEANIKWTDFNNNDIPDSGEFQNIEEQHVDMHVFQQAAEYNPLYAQNDMPDYDNDANVGTLLG